MFIRDSNIFTKILFKWRLPYQSAFIQLKCTSYSLHVVDMIFKDDDESNSTK